MAVSRSLSRRFRLAPNDIIDLIKAAVETEKVNGAEVVTHEKYMTAAKYSFPQMLTFHWIKKKIKDEVEEIVITHPCKDSRTKNNEGSLPNYEDIYHFFVTHFDSSRVKLLIPLVNCRGHLNLPISFPYIQKKHWVKMTFNFPIEEVTLDDSQADFSDSLKIMLASINLQIYSDHLEELVVTHPKLNNFKINRNFYGNQQDNVTCGNYFNEYLFSFLKNGDNSQFSAIKVHLEDQPVTNELKSHDIYLGTKDKKTYMKRFVPNYISGIPSEFLEEASEEINKVTEEFELMTLDNHNPNEEKGKSASSTAKTSVAAQSIADLIRRSRLNVDPRLFGMPVTGNSIPTSTHLINPANNETMLNTLTNRVSNYFKFK